MAGWGGKKNPTMPPIKSRTSQAKANKNLPSCSRSSEPARALQATKPSGQAGEPRGGRGTGQGPQGRASLRVSRLESWGPGKREVPDRGLTQRETAVCVTSNNPLLQRGFQELLRAGHSEGY